MFDKKQSFISIPLLKPRPWKVSIPPSKSLTNRGIHLASLAKGISFIKNPLHSIDTKIMLQIWSELGCSIKEDSNLLTIESRGLPFQIKDSRKIYVENAGTAARFITAALSLSEERFELCGNSYMNRRPFDALIKALVSLGANVSFQGQEFCLPFFIQGGKQSSVKKTLTIYEAKSSQFVSALLMIAPLLKGGLRIILDKDPLSAPYIQMTLGMMKKFSISVKEESGLIDIAPGMYQPCGYTVEMDYSSASYFLALAAIHGTSIVLPGASQESLQGDIFFFDILKRMGCSVVWKSNLVILVGPKKLHGLTVDMKDVTDLVPTLCVVAMFAEGTTVIKGVDHMRYKECDRISILCSELTKFGLDISYQEKNLVIHPQKHYQAASCQTADDHRMAMAFSIIGTKVKGTQIYQPSCVDKTFPDFFDVLGKCYNA